ncbi:MAG: LysR substrate-binding domain-containing protein [Steroidobacteraceae bacterium]
MNLRDLRYLVALADTRHFGRAAERCHVSQPTLSAQLKKLEEYLGAPLVERQPRQIAFTPLGTQVVERARRLLAEADDIQSLAQASRDPLSGRLSIALIPTVGPYLLPGVAARLRRRLPKLKLQLFEYQTAPLLQKLRAGEIDAGILALPVETDGLETRALYEEPFVVALPERHPLAAQASVRRSDIEGETLLLLEDGHCLRDQALEVCSRLKVHEDQDYRATSLETLRQMVAAGAGITLLPELATLGPFSHTRGLVVRPFTKPVPGRTIGAVWRRSTTREAAIRAIGDVVAEAMK